jgi:hypothetical protein
VSHCPSYSRCVGELVKGERCGDSHGVSSGLLEEEREEQVVGEGHSTRGDQVGDRVGAVQIRWVVDFAILRQGEGGSGGREEDGERTTRRLTARLAWIAVILTRGLTRWKGTTIPSSSGPTDLTEPSFTCVCVGGGRGDQRRGRRGAHVDADDTRTVVLEVASEATIIEQRVDRDDHISEVTGDGQRGVLTAAER